MQANQFKKEIIEEHSRAPEFSTGHILETFDAAVERDIVPIAPNLHIICAAETLWQTGNTQL